MAKKTHYSGIVYSTNPDAIPKVEVEDRVTLDAARQKLVITLDKKQRAGKKVTLVSGFDGNPDDLEKLGKELKSFCGTGGSVKDNEIIIQGDNRDKVYDYCHNKGYKLTLKK